MSVLTTRPFFVKFFFHKLSFFLPRSHCRPLVRPFNAPPEFFSRLISRELRSCHPAAFCQVLFSRLDVFFLRHPRRRLSLSTLAWCVALFPTSLFLSSSFCRKCPFFSLPASRQAFCGPPRGSAPVVRAVLCCRPPPFFSSTLLAPAAPTFLRCHCE